jgi:hypothetical protein
MTEEDGKGLVDAHGRSRDRASKLFDNLEETMESTYMFISDTRLHNEIP